MKKRLTLFLTFILILVLATCSSAKATTETWYSQSRGIDMMLVLSDGFTYTLTVGGETAAGAWTEQDGGIVLDGDETAPLFKANDLLLWPGMDLYFTQEPSDFGAYAPAGVLTDGVTAALFNGYWKSAFVEAEGVILPAFEMNDATDVYIEAPRAALGGPLFGDEIVEMAFENGTLTWSEDGVSVTLQLQQDRLLRMALSAPDSDMTLYLLRQYVEGVSLETAE